MGTRLLRTFSLSIMGTRAETNRTATPLIVMVSDVGTAMSTSSPSPPMTSATKNIDEAIEAIGSSPARKTTAMPMKP